MFFKPYTQLYGGVHVCLAVSPTPDFNGDGLDDIIVGAPGADSGIGRAYVIYGSASGMDEDFDVTYLEDSPHGGLLLSGSTGGAYSNNIGYAVAAAG